MLFRTWLVSFVAALVAIISPGTADGIGSGG